MKRFIAPLSVLFICGFVHGEPDKLHVDGSVSGAQGTGWVKGPLQIYLSQINDLFDWVQMTRDPSGAFRMADHAILERGGTLELSSRLYHPDGAVVARGKGECGGTNCSDAQVLFFDLLDKTVLHPDEGMPLYHRQNIASCEVYRRDYVKLKFDVDGELKIDSQLMYEVEAFDGTTAFSLDTYLEPVGKLRVTSNETEVAFKAYAVRDQFCKCFDENLTASERVDCPEDEVFSLRARKAMPEETSQTETPNNLLEGA